jgi:magnesium chelatase subunit D
VLVLLTDGRAKVGLSEHSSGIQGELQLLGCQIAQAGIHALVIDTQRSYLSRGEARRLAEWLDGTYIYLPNANGTQIAARARAAIEAERE